MNIQDYQKSEEESIKRLFKDVFSDSENLEEGTLVSNLVGHIINSTNEKDIFGFVAKIQGQLIASIFFTRLKFNNSCSAFILSPVAVHTQFQGKGIGQKIINFGIKQLKDKNIDLLFTYGDPAFYSKVGFKWLDQQIVQAPFTLSHPQGWLCQSLNNKPVMPIKSRPSCVSALDNELYW